MTPKHRIILTDPSELAHITPEQLRAYLVAQGWTTIRRRGAHDEMAWGLWIIYVPDAVVPGHGRKMAEAIETVEQATGKDQLTIYREIVGGDGA